MSWAQNGHFFAIIILKSALFAEIAVLEAEEVEHTVDADALAQALGQQLAGGGVEQLILQRGRTGVDD